MEEHIKISLSLKKGVFASILSNEPSFELLLVNKLMNECFGRLSVQNTYLSTNANSTNVITHEAVEQTSNTSQESSSDKQCTNLNTRPDIANQIKSILTSKRKSSACSTNPLLRHTRTKHQRFYTKRVLASKRRFYNKSSTYNNISTEPPSRQYQWSSNSNLANQTVVVENAEAVNSNDALPPSQTLNSIKCEPEEDSITFQDVTLQSLFSQAKEIEETAPPPITLAHSDYDGLPAQSVDIPGISNKLNSNRCPHCHRRVSGAYNLRLHMRKHLDIPEFKCTVCGRQTTNTYRLKEHMRIHTGEKPYSCRDCNATFRHSNQLRRHKKTSHGCLFTFPNSTYHT